jgi:hypothetical protein
VEPSVDKEVDRFNSALRAIEPSVDRVLDNTTVIDNISKFSSTVILLA